MPWLSSKERGSRVLIRQACLGPTTLVSNTMLPSPGFSSSRFRYPWLPHWFSVENPSAQSSETLLVVLWQNLLEHCVPGSLPLQLALYTAAF